MASGYTCKLCGWQEIEHPESGKYLGLSEEQIEERKSAQLGYSYVLYGDVPNMCPCYTPTKEEVRSRRVARVAELRDLENGPICIGNMLA